MLDCETEAGSGETECRPDRRHEGEAAWGTLQASRKRAESEVRFYAKGPVKSQVSVQHSGLGGPAEVEEKRAYWTKALGELEGFLLE
jgi:hypothetical protein